MGNMNLDNVHPGQEQVAVGGKERYPIGHGRSASADDPGCRKFMHGLLLPNGLLLRCYCA